jgi:hypothetical protein
MTYQDKSIKCCDCGATFTFTSGEQAFYAGKGFSNEPKRCMPCRATKKAQRDGGSDSSYRSSRY